MKNAIPFLFILICSIAISCSSSEKGPDPSPVINTMTQGTWHITQYIVDGDIQVADAYTGFDFIFAADGTITATDNTNTYLGAWSVENFDNDRLKFIIDYDNPQSFTYLSNNWRIRFRSADKITLDINEFNYLTFEKN